MSSKKELRLYSKKRKLESFLELVRNDLKEGEASQSQNSKNKKIKTSEKKGLGSLFNVCNNEKDKPQATADDNANSSKDGVKDSDSRSSSSSEEKLTPEKDDSSLMNDNSLLCASPAQQVKATVCEEELKRLREELRIRQKASMENPKIFLALDPSTFKQQPRTSSGQPILYIEDIQHLILYATQGYTASYKPRWCKLLRMQKISKVLLVTIDGASSLDYYRDYMPFLKNNFDLNMEFISPSQYSRSLSTELFDIPLSNRKSKNEFQDCGFKTNTSYKKSEDNANNNQIVANDNNNNNNSSNNNNNNDDINNSNITKSNNNNYYYNNFFNNTFKQPACSSNNNNKTANNNTFITSPATRNDLMLSVEEMKMEGYTLPFAQHVRSGSFVFSKDGYTMPTDNSPILAVDCEMVETLNSQSELAWISIVDENLKCIYETFVKPRHKITDYLTQYSGVTEKMLSKVTTTLSDVQQSLRNILNSDVILAGQSLNMDLNAMKMYHPFVMDTSCLYNLSGYRHGKPNLKTLANVFLNRSIQKKGRQGHNPREDAEAVMQLVKLKLKKGFNYGNVMHGWSMGQLEEEKRAVDDDKCKVDVEEEKEEDKSKINPNTNYNNDDNGNHDNISNNINNNDNKKISSDTNNPSDVVVNTDKQLNNTNNNDDGDENDDIANNNKNDNNSSPKLQLKPNNTTNTNIDNNNNSTVQNSNPTTTTTTTTHLLKQLSIFFRTNRHSTSLFTILAKNKRKVAILGTLTNPDPTTCQSSDYLHNSNDPDVKEYIKIIKDEEEDEEDDDDGWKDRRRMKRCREEIVNGEEFFVVSQFDGVMRSLRCDDDNGGERFCKKCFKRSLKDTDSILKKLYNALSLRSLMVVLLSGRSSGATEDHNGLCLVRVKTS